MRIVIFADLHDNETALERVLKEGERAGADRLIYLGDVGRKLSLLTALHRHDIACVFGNWEISWLERLPAEPRAWLAAWSATLRVENALFAHATPAMPSAVATTADAVALRAAGHGWLKLFPRLDLHEQAVWDALAAMEEENVRVAFHGHTHVQAVWAWESDGEKSGNSRRRLRNFNGPADFTLTAGSADAPNRYIVGVGSAGEPNDGPWLRYALYDTDAERVRLKRMDG